MLKLTAIFLMVTSLAANAEWLKISSELDRKLSFDSKEYVETNSVRLTKTGVIAEFLTEFGEKEDTFSHKELIEYNCKTYASRNLAHIYTYGRMGKGEVHELSNDIYVWSEGGTDLSSVDAKMRFACSEAKKFAKNSAPYKKPYYTLNGETYDPKKWLKFGSAGKAKQYVDISSIKQTRDGVTVRILSDLNEPIRTEADPDVTPESQGYESRSIIELTEFNCSTNQYREVRHYWYSGNLGTGIANSIYGVVNGWSNIDGNNQNVLSQHLIACTVLRDVATGALKSIPPDFNFDDKHDQSKHKEPAYQQI